MLFQDKVDEAEARLEVATQSNAICKQRWDVGSCKYVFSALEPTVMRFQCYYKWVVLQALPYHSRTRQGAYSCTDVVVTITNGNALQQYVQLYLRSPNLAARCLLAL